jgi:CubicO group peptidase (beta-lactamase class C family)
VTNDELQGELQAWIDQWGLKGATVSIRRDSGETWTGAAGVDDADQPFYPDEQYWIASVTKTFTAALILRLSDEGYLNLDDPASRFVPNFPNSDRFTIRQLLQHTSGLTSDSEEPYKALEEAAQDGLQFEPGTGYLYSRAGYYLLGLIIEDILGTSYTSALHNQILDPLNLKSTMMDEEIDSSLDSTHPYYAENVVDEGEESWTRSGVFTEGTAGDWDYHGVLWSAGGLWSTTSDLTRWALALYDSDQVVSPPALQQMTSFLGQQYDYTGLGTYPFCTCWTDSNGALQSERWGFAGTTGILEFDPQDRIAIAVHMNGTLFDTKVIDALEDFSSRIRALVRGREILADPTPEVPPALQVYMVEDGDTLYDIAARLGIAAADQDRWVADVMSLNAIDDQSTILAGAELRLP